MEDKWLGALGGAGTGATLGSAIFPGIGTAIGALGGGILGLIQGKKISNEAEGAQNAWDNIPLVDPASSRITDELRRRRRAVESGLTTDVTAGRHAIDRATASGIGVTEQLYGHSPVLGLSMAQRLLRGAGDQTQQLLGISGQKEGQYTQMLINHLNQISQRKLDLQTHGAQMRIADATQRTKDFREMSLAGIAMLPELMGDFGGGSEGGVQTVLKFLQARNDQRSVPGVSQTLIERGKTPLNR